MNNPRRKELQKLITKLEKIQEAVEYIQADEEEYRDNIPENLQGSQRYELADAAVDNLDSAYNALEEAINYLTEAMA